MNVEQDTNPSTNPILLTDGRDIKVVLIEKIWRKYERSNLSRIGKIDLTNIQLSTFLFMLVKDLGELEDLTHIDKYLMIHKFLFFFIKGRAALKIPFTGSRQSDTSITDSSTSQQFVEDAETDDAPSKKLDEGILETAKCRARDGNACILTAAPSPEVCHIIPLATEHRNIYKTHFHYIKAFLGEAVAQRIINLISTPGACDKDWNMISLSPLLRSWWSEGLFALKWLGIVEKNDGISAIQFCFYWMPWTTFDPHEKAEISLTRVNQMLATVVTDRRMSSNRDNERELNDNLHNGQILQINVETDKVENMKLMIDL
ncbi:hypothetical protein PT974_07431 [Cladobotryum mycophilum]|uniref:HNH nuclease domain-containing protein n=1 Tax=Cladobotryum mycophilum TaxID=491253 RepID=A0ABR0SQ17_9HYPO